MLGSITVLQQCVECVGEREGEGRREGEKGKGSGGGREAGEQDKPRGHCRVCSFLVH